MKVLAILVVTFVLTLLSGLYIVRPLILDAEERQFGFPFQWLIALRSTWSLNMPWHFTFLWNWFIVDFAIYGLPVTMALGIYEKMFKRVSKPNIYRTFFLTSSAILIIFCWALALSFLLFDLRFIVMYDTAYEWSGLRFLLGIATIIFAWFLIKYFKQISTP